MNLKNTIATGLIAAMTLNGCKTLPIAEQPKPTRTFMQEPDVNCRPSSGIIQSFKSMEERRYGTADCISFLPSEAFSEIVITDQLTSQVMVCQYTSMRHVCIHFDNIWSSSYRQGDKVVLPKDEDATAIIAIIAKKGVNYERMRKMAEYLFRIQIRNRHLNPQITPEFISDKES